MRQDPLGQLRKTHNERDQLKDFVIIHVSSFQALPSKLKRLPITFRIKSQSFVSFGHTYFEGATVYPVEDVED